MDFLVSNVAPVALVAAALFSGVYYTNGCSNKKRQTASKTTKNHTKVEVDDEPLEDFLKPKPKKQAPMAPPLPPPKVKKQPQQQPKQPKVPAVEKATTPVTPPTTSTKHAGKKVVTPTPVAVAPVVPAPVAKKEKKLSEVELLKLRIAELEASKKAPAPSGAATKAPEPVLTAKQKKAAATVTATVTPTTTPIQQQKEYNPAPQLTQEQRQEQEKALNDIQRDNSQWREVPIDKSNKNKKNKNNQQYDVDLSVFTVTATMMTTFGHRFIIVGENGTTVDAIKRITGCRIEIPGRPSKDIMAQAPNKGADLIMKIDFEGTEEQIANARKIITELTTKGYSTQITPDKIEARLKVDAADRFQIIGKEGVNLKKIIEATGVKITMPTKGDMNDDIIHIVGSADGVTRAKDAIRSLVKDSFSDLTHNDWTKLVVDFPSQYRRFLLISFNGDRAIIRVIEANHGCKLILPQNADNSIAIVGPSSSVYGAAADINAVIKKLEQPIADVSLIGFDCKEFKANELW